MGEVLPYLEINKENNVTYETVEMPNVTGMTYKEAKQNLKELGLQVSTNEEISEESIITDQLPKAGIQIKSGTEVILYNN